MLKTRLDLAETFLFIAGAVSLLFPDASKNVILSEFFIYAAFNILCTTKNSAETNN